MIHTISSSEISQDSVKIQNTKTFLSSSISLILYDHKTDPVKLGKLIKTSGDSMRSRLSFLKRRNTDLTSLSTVRPQPEDVQKWAISFMDLMSSKYGQALFRAFLQREFSEENLEFWLAVEEYRKTRTPKLSTKAMKIYNDFVMAHAPKEVNLDSTTRSQTVCNMSNPSREAFDQAQKRVQGLMENDAYLRFLQSDLYKELLFPDRYEERLSGDPASDDGKSDEKRKTDPSIVNNGNSNKVGVAQQNNKNASNNCRSVSSTVKLFKSKSRSSTGSSKDDKENSSSVISTSTNDGHSS